MKVVLYIISLLCCMPSISNAWHIFLPVSQVQHISGQVLSKINMASRKTGRGFVNLSKGLLRFTARHPRIVIGTATVATLTMPPVRSFVSRYGGNVARRLFQGIGTFAKQLAQRFLLRDVNQAVERTNEGVQANARVLRTHTQNLGAIRIDIGEVGADVNRARSDIAASKAVLDTHTQKFDGLHEVTDAMRADVQKVKIKIDALPLQMQEQLNAGNEEILGKIQEIKAMQFLLRSSVGSQSKEILSIKRLLEQMQTELKARTAQGAHMMRSIEEIKEENALQFKLVISLVERLSSSFERIIGQQSRPSSPLTVSPGAGAPLPAGPLSPTRSGSSSRFSTWRGNNPGKARPELTRNQSFAGTSAMGSSAGGSSGASRA